MISAKFVPGKTAEQCQEKFKALVAIAKQKSAAAASAAGPKTAVAQALAEEWTLEQQKQLEHGLKTVAAGDLSFLAFVFVLFLIRVLQTILGVGIRFRRESLARIASRWLTDTMSWCSDSKRNDKDDGNGFFFSLYESSTVAPASFSSATHLCASAAGMLSEITEGSSSTSFFESIKFMLGVTFRKILRTGNFLPSSRATSFILNVSFLGAAAAYKKKRTS